MAGLDHATASRHAAAVAVAGSSPSAAIRGYGYWREVFRLR
jgi:hypothetical protein